MMSCGNFTRESGSSTQRTGRKVTRQPPFVDAQEDHAAQDQQAADDLDSIQPLAQQGIGDRRGKDRLQGHDEIGYT